jgi:hypothetical protein
MKVFILVLVVIAALCAIVSGVWVATALVRAISRNWTEKTPRGGVDEKSNDSDI